MGIPDYAISQIKDLGFIVTEIEGFMDVKGYKIEANISKEEDCEIQRKMRDKLQERNEKV